MTIPEILAIDPGPQFSAYCWLNEAGLPLEFGKVTNERLRDILPEMPDRLQDCVCERVRSFGMPAGAELFETCENVGRFQQIAETNSLRWHWLTRGEVKVALCGTARAKDANIRQALLDRYGGKENAIGKKKTPGPLYGVTADVWAALAVAVVWQDQQKAGIRE